MRRVIVVLAVLVAAPLAAGRTATPAPLVANLDADPALERIVVVTGTTPTGQAVSSVGIEDDGCAGVRSLSGLYARIARLQVLEVDGRKPPEIVIEGRGGDSPSAIFTILRWGAVDANEDGCDEPLPLFEYVPENAVCGRNCGWPAKLVAPHGYDVRAWGVRLGRPRGAHGRDVTLTELYAKPGKRAALRRVTLFRLGVDVYRRYLPVRSKVTKV